MRGSTGHLCRLTPFQTSASNTNDNSPGILPQTATAAAKVAEDVAKGVKSTIEGVVAWTEAKAAKLSEHREDGTGPYDSPGTCAPSDQDAIGAGILPAMPPATPEKCDVEKNGSTPDHGELKPGGKDHE